MLALTILAGSMSVTGAENAASPPASPAVTSGSADLGGIWRRMAQGPFGDIGVPGGWTGSELVVVDPEGKRRAAAYDPLGDAWREVARPPRKVWPYTPAHWTGNELVFIEARNGTERGFIAYDPSTDSWRVTAPAPLANVSASTVADGVIVAASGSDLSVAAYDPLTDTWTELPAVPAEPADAMPVGHTLVLIAIDEGVYALSAPPGTDGTFSIARLDLSSGTWTALSTGPISALAGIPVWTGESFVFRSYPLAPNDPGDGNARDGRYDPAADAWTVERNACGLDTTAAAWTGALILAVPDGLAYDPATETCYTLPAPPRAERSRALRVWTGTELLEFSGNTGEESPAKRDGVVYRPPA
ncbi:MAG: hypothetical protein ACR2H3_15875 [Acidimicrobiales bacterium]